MYRALLFSILTAGILSAEPTKTDHFLIAKLDSSKGYIALEDYAQWSNPGHEKDIWIPTSEQVVEADRAFRRHVHAQQDDPGSGFEVKPMDERSKEGVRIQFADVEKKYDAYAKQFAGAVINGRKLIVCHYCLKPKIDPGSSYLALGPDCEESVDFQYDLQTGKFSDVTFAVFGPER
jgi:hypothetical protein